MNQGSGLIATIKNIPRVTENPRKSVRMMAGAEVKLTDPLINFRHNIFTVMAKPTDPNISGERISVELVEISPESRKLLEKMAKEQ